MIEVNNPLVSVIVTNYNYGHYLQRCLLSIIGQTYRRVEIILCDNASTDNSVDIANAIALSSPIPIQIICQKRNIGSAGNYRTGEAQVRGDYFLNFGADDFMDPNYLKYAVGMLEGYPGASQFITHLNVVDEVGEISSAIPFFDGSYLIKGYKYAELLMMAGVTRHTSQTVWRTSAHQEISSQPDYIYSHAIGERTTAFMHACQWDVIYCDRPLVACRESEANETSRLNKRGIQTIEQLLVIHQMADHAERIGLIGVAKKRIQAVNKIGEISLRYGIEELQVGNMEIASIYLMLGAIYLEKFKNLFKKYNSSVKIDKKIWLEINEWLSEEIVEKQKIRSNSYMPPRESMKISI